MVRFKISRRGEQKNFRGLGPLAPLHYGPACCSLKARFEFVRVDPVCHESFVGLSSPQTDIVLVSGGLSMIFHWSRVVLVVPTQATGWSGH